MSILYSILIKCIQSILWCIDKDHREKHEIAMDDSKKFTHIQETSFDSDFGHVDYLFRTVPYEVWELKTESKALIAADKHRVIDENHNVVWIEDLRVGDKLITDNGIEEVKLVRSLDVRTHMYCLEVNSDDVNDSMNHLFYTDGILSHNTTTSAAFLLWKAMFTPDFQILITANKYNQAMEIMDRIRFMYENMEEYNWLRAGIVEYNKGTITFDNGSKITSRATSRDSARGLSISLLFCD